MYEIICLLIAALGAYGLYTLILRLFSSSSEGSTLDISSGIHLRPGYSDEEVEQALLQLRLGCGEGEEPVLLVDYPLRREVLRALKENGAGLYLSYEEYYCEKGNASNRGEGRPLDDIRER